MTAWAAVNKAKKDGLLVPSPCEECGSTPTVAHHDDYTKPMDVRWLCHSCHRRWHGQNEAIRGGEYFLTVRVPRQLHADLKALAKRNDRTMALEIRRALKAHVEAEKA